MMYWLKSVVFSLRGLDRIEIWKYPSLREKVEVKNHQVGTPNLQKPGVPAPGLPRTLQVLSLFLVPAGWCLQSYC